MAYDSYNNEAESQLSFESGSAILEGEDMFEELVVAFSTSIFYGFNIVSDKVSRFLSLTTAMHSCWSPPLSTLPSPTAVCWLYLLLNFIATTRSIKMRSGHHLLMYQCHTVYLVRLRAVVSRVAGV